MFFGECMNKSQMIVRQEKTIMQVGTMINTKKFLLIFAVSLSFPSLAANSFNYEMTTKAGTELIRPIAVYDNGVTTFMKFKPNSQFLIVDGNKVPTHPMIFSLDKNGSEVMVKYQWSLKNDTLTFPIVSNKWRIRSGNKVVDIRKNGNITKK